MLQLLREWLTHATRPMTAMVVCSDSTAGGRGERHEFGTDALVCDVVSAPEDIARRLSMQAGGVKAVFCSYHSLHKVCAAQAQHEAPRFDLPLPTKRIAPRASSATTSRPRWISKRSTTTASCVRLNAFT